MRWLKVILVMQLVVGYGAISGQSPSRGKKPLLKGKVAVKVDKGQRKKESDQFRDNDRDGVNDTEKRAHKRRMNKSFFDTLKEILNIK